MSHIVYVLLHSEAKSVMQYCAVPVQVRTKTEPFYTSAKCWVKPNSQTSEQAQVEATNTAGQAQLG